MSALLVSSSSQTIHVTAVRKFTGQLATHLFYFRASICATLTLEVTDDNFHGVHRLELFILAFLKNRCIANTGRKNRITIVLLKSLYYSITISTTLQFAFMQLLLSGIQQKSERQYD